MLKEVELIKWKRYVVGFIFKEVDVEVEELKKKVIELENVLK